MPPTTGEHVVALLERVERLEEVVMALASWLAYPSKPGSRSGVFTDRDYRGLDQLVQNSRKLYEEDVRAR